MPWIHLALSTLGPSTSPHLSSIRLDFAVGSSIINRSAETLIVNMGNDLRRIADEVARIEREFEGTVSLTVRLDSVFEVVLDTLNVSFPSRGGRDLVVTLFHPHSFLPDPPEPRSLKRGARLSYLPLSVGHVESPISSPGRRFQRYI